MRPFLCCQESLIQHCTHSMPHFPALLGFLQGGKTRCRKSWILHCTHYTDNIFLKSLRLQLVVLHCRSLGILNEVITVCGFTVHIVGILEWSDYSLWFYSAFHPDTWMKWLPFVVLQCISSGYLNEVITVCGFIVHFIRILEWSDYRLWFYSAYRRDTWMKWLQFVVLQCISSGYLNEVITVCGFTVHFVGILEWSDYSLWFYSVFRQDTWMKWLQLVVLQCKSTGYLNEVIKVCGFTMQIAGVLEWSDYSLWFYSANRLDTWMKWYLSSSPLGFMHPLMCGPFALLEIQRV